MVFNDFAMALKRRRSCGETRLRCPMARASRWRYLCRQVPLRNLFAHAAAGRCWDRGGREHQVLDKKSGSEDACRCGHRTRRHQCRNFSSAQMADPAMSRSSDVLTRLQLAVLTTLDGARVGRHLYSSSRRVSQTLAVSRTYSQQHDNTSFSLWRECFDC